jgi:apolipoprotein N-acyltransferase
MIRTARLQSLRSLVLRLAPLLLLLLAAAEAAPLWRLSGFSSSDWLYAALLILHAAAGAAFLIRSKRARRAGQARQPFLFLVFRSPEILFALTLALFLFAYIFATNANMDYVQRFIASGGNLRLAPDSARERLAACLRYLPLLVVDGFMLVFPRLAMRALARAAFRGASLLRAWALPLSLVSGCLFSLSFPSFLSTNGIPALGWVCLIPLLMVLFETPPGWGTFYGVAAGAVQTMITNYWLGTFNLLTLQFVTVVTTLQYVLFMATCTRILRRSGRLGYLVFPAGWVLFDWLRSLGFLGYPWAMLGASQYTLIPLIQISSITGVWGVTFIVTLFGSVAAWCLLSLIRRQPMPRGPAVLLAIVLAAALGWGALRIGREPEAAGTGGAAGAGEGAERTIRLALVQQNADPRKDDYEEVYRTLKRLTESALPGRPDIVVWSETAFVPNIRRWSSEDPEAYPLARLVRELLAWQKTIGTWLITGNDDYELVQSASGEERRDYNGAVLFSPSGERIDTYHKMHLVPFTEYFPYRKQLPAVYRLLQSFDAYLWEPGWDRVVFRHPLVSFCAPICFEDAFPNDVRLFIRAGAEAIVNLSNDYWSLTEAEAMQHAANAVFRAVENSRPLVRASASGLTCSVDALGRITARSPIYQEAVLSVELRPGPRRTTPYTRWGDWFPPVMGALLLAALAAGILGRRT